jgi:geranylgeranyl pyrophosphate synthase
LAAGAADEGITSLAGYGREIGLAFQIADDILDATATTSQLGKTAGRDMALAKSTYVSLLGVEGARREAERRAELAIGHLTPALSSETLTGLARYIVSRTS